MALSSIREQMVELRRKDATGSGLRAIVLRSAITLEVPSMGESRYLAVRGVVTRAGQAVNVRQDTT